MGTECAELEREQKVLGYRCRPLLHGVERWQSVEGVVQFDGVEPRRVVLQPATLRHVGGIDDAPPIVVAESRTTDSRAAAAIAHSLRAKCQAACRSAISAARTSAARSS